MTAIRGDAKFVDHWTQEGLIHKHLAGQTLIGALTDGQDLILVLSRGEEVRIGWDETHGPVFKGRNVTLMLPSLGQALFAGG